MSTINPVPLTLPLVAALVAVTSPQQLAKIFGTYHLEVMEAQLKSSSYKSKVLLRKVNQAINLILDRKAGHGQSLRCVECGKRKKDVRYRIDPYHLEIKGEKVIRDLCRSCEAVLAAEV